MEQAELHSPQLVNVDVSIYPVFLNKTTWINGDNLRKGNWKRKPHHKTISAILLPSLFQIRYYEWPHTDDVTDNIQESRKS